MLGAFLPKPEVVIAQTDHPVVRGQTCWCVCGNALATPVDAINRGVAPYTLKSGVTLGTTSFGTGFKCDGSAAGSGTGYVDLGSTNRFLPSDTTPFTMSWIEAITTGTAAGIYGLLGIFPTGAAKQFAVIRAADSVITAGNYGSLACGPWAASGILPSFLPGVVNPNDIAAVTTFQSRTRVWLIQGKAGTSSQTAANYSLWIDGYKTTSSAGGNTANVGATANYFGWDNEAKKSSATLDNLRIWNRLLSITEIQSLMIDPYLGGRPIRQRAYSIPAAAASANRWFLMG